MKNRYDEFYFRWLENSVGDREGAIESFDYQPSKMKLV